MWTGLIFKSTSINISGSPNLNGKIKERKRKINQKIKFNESFNQYNLKKSYFQPTVKSENRRSSSPFM